MTTRPRILSAVLALALASCHDSDSDNVDFDQFVTSLIQDQTSNTEEPVEVNGRSFVFPTDEQAFDDVLPPDTGSAVGP